MEQMKLRELERELETKALRNAAEEDTDNWDDDFEGAISFNKPQGELRNMRAYALANRTQYSVG